MRHRIFALALAFSVTGCAPLGDGVAPPTASDAHVSPGPALPVDGLLSPNGYLTVQGAQPSPFPMAVPDDRTGEDAIDRYARENGLTRSQAEAAINGPPELRQEIARIADNIRRDQAGNFGGFVMVRDPSVRMEVWFERDAAATLARYTASPLFVAREGGINLAEQGRLGAIWTERMRSTRAIGSLATDTASGKIEIGTTIPEADFRALAAREGWELGPQYALSFAPDQPPAFADPTLRSLIRVFAREDMAPVSRNSALFTGRIVLDDGCFKVRMRDGSEKLAMFGYMAQLGYDEHGYLVIKRPGNSASQYRIGEEGAWGGPAGFSPDNPAVADLRRACGSGEIVNVTEPASNRLFGLPAPDWVSDYARVNGLSRQDAWDEIIECMAREEVRGRKGIDARDRCVSQFNRR